MAVLGVVNVEMIALFYAHLYCLPFDMLREAPLRGVRHLLRLQSPHLHICRSRVPSLGIQLELQRGI